MVAGLESEAAVSGYHADNIAPAVLGGFTLVRWLTDLGLHPLCSNVPGKAAGLFWSEALSGKCVSHSTGRGASAVRAVNEPNDSCQKCWS